VTPAGFGVWPSGERLSPCVLYIVQKNPLHSPFTFASAEAPRKPLEAILVAVSCE
jgi:hypothetical protein